MTAMWNPTLELEEENRKFMRNMREQREQVCMNKRNCNMCSSCQDYGTSNCLHPNKVFPYKRY